MPCARRPGGFDVAVNYTDPPAGPDEVIAQAVAQDRAARQPR